MGKVVMRERLSGQDSTSHLLAFGSGHRTSFYQWNRNRSDVCHSGLRLLSSGCAPIRFSLPFHWMDEEGTVAPDSGATKGKSESLDHCLEESCVLRSKLALDYYTVRKRILL